MRSFATTLFTLLLSGGTALAAQNVANTSQKGSLLIWPLINIGDGTDTFIEISNDHNQNVRVACHYVNEKKGRVDFGFNLTGKATASWSVGTQVGDQARPARFPSGGSFPPATLSPPYPPTSIYRGELICFATNGAGTAQIAFNHLTGTATVVNTAPIVGVRIPTQANQAFRYNAWSFVARNAAGGAEANRVLQGTPGELLLTGGLTGTYDACPAYNIANFMPNGAQLGSLGTISNILTVVSCNQDLRESFDLHLTKLRFTVWNSKEHSFTGAYICVDSVHSVGLLARNSYLENGAHFENETLQTENARFQVSGVASTQCPESVRSALLGVLASEVSNGNGPHGLGTTTHGAGSAPGFVLWDPSEPIPTKR